MSLIEVILNKKEWKLQHAANRRMYRGLFSTIRGGERYPASSESFNLAFGMVWKLISQQHKSFFYAFKPSATLMKPKCKWSIKCNTSAFNDIRLKNSIDRANRRMKKQ